MATGKDTPVLTYFQYRLSPSLPSESDSSSCSTSWEFCIGPCSQIGEGSTSPCRRYSTTGPIPEEEIMHFHSPLSCSTPRANARSLTFRSLGSPELLRDQSSTSSKDSHRSQDSGFLDLCELRRREQDQGPGSKRDSLVDSPIDSPQVLETIYGDTILSPIAAPLTPTEPERPLVKSRLSSTRASPRLNHDNFETLNKNQRRERDRNNNQGRKSLSPPTTKLEPSRSTGSSQLSTFEESRIWKNTLLPKPFKRISLLNDNDNLVIKSHFENAAMRRWLYDLRLDTEPDCLHTLQVKSIEGHVKGLIVKGVQSDDHGKDGMPKRPISSVLESMKRTERAGGLISKEISGIWRHLESASFDFVSTSFSNLMGFIEIFLHHSNPKDPKGSELDRALSKALNHLHVTISSRTTNRQRLSRIMDTLQLNFDTPPTVQDNVVGLRSDDQMPEMVDGLLHLARTFDLVVSHRQKQDLSWILDSVSVGGPVGRLSLQVLSTVLYDGGLSLCRLASGLRTVRAILSVLIESCDELERIYGLRCLATILCVGEAVNDFDKAGGFEIISDILHEHEGGSGLSLKIEAMAVLTQATDPWIDLDTTLTSLGVHLQKLIYTLTRLLPQCQWDEDSFLLTVAAISNLTFLELSSMEYLRIFETVSVITNVLRERNDFSVFVLDHISTIFANMAGIERCRDDLVKHNGVDLLVQFLNASAIGICSAEVTATERLQQKSTIAISRLANEPGVASMVLDLGGVHRLIQLCRNDRERNYSDGVLIAALATLRKLVSTCGLQVIEELEAEELIVPRLLDSFLLFSSRQESYV